MKLSDGRFYREFVTVGDSALKATVDLKKYQIIEASIIFFEEFEGI